MIRYVQCKMQKSIPSEHRPTSGAQVVHQTALKIIQYSREAFINRAAHIDYWSTPTLAMYSVTIYKLLFSSTITPSSWTRFSCRSFLQQARTTQMCHSFVCNVTSGTSCLRHDRSLGNKGLRCSVVLDALHSNLCPSVIPSHDIWNHNLIIVAVTEKKRTFSKQKDYKCEPTHLRTLLFQ